MSYRIFFFVVLFIHVATSCTGRYEDVVVGRVDLDGLSDYEKYEREMLPDSLYPVIKGLYDNALAQKDIHTMSTCNNILSNYYMLTGRYEEGFTFANDFLAQIADVDDHDYLFYAYYNIGKLYYGLGLSEVSLSYFLNLTKYDVSPINQCRAFYAIAETSRTSDTHGLSPEFYYKKRRNVSARVK